MPDIEYSFAEGRVPAYLAVPGGDGPWPAVVVLHDALGLTDDIRRIADRLAGEGYLALAPALYQRGGGRLRCVVSTFFNLSLGIGRPLDAIVAARDHLHADPRCTGKVGAVGFCMGGGFCVQTAPLGVFDASAPNYGMPPAIPDMAGACPVVASYGGRDFMLPSGAARLEAKLAAHDVPRDVKEYPNVGHGFMNDWQHRPAMQFVEGIANLSYSRPEAEDAWSRIMAFFGEHLAPAR